MRLGGGLIVALVLALVAAPAQAELAAKPWPPAAGPGMLFVHFGEEHLNDADGATILPTVVEQVARYKPVLATMSGDKANDGEVDQLTAWKKVMERLDAAGVPYLASLGNHDRDAPPGVPGGTIGLFGGTTPETIDSYSAVFKDRPYPMGDAAPYGDERFAPRARPADDPAGTATHYSVDVGNVRWIFLDNSCWSLTTCDRFQIPPDSSDTAQLSYLEAQAKEATAAGRLVFVVMHMPTRDPRDQSYTDVTAQNHVMGKGSSTDNREFEEIAAKTGVDGVFVAHIKGQFLYRAEANVPYYIDGGAGGELYTTGPVGTDHGYWHGFRLIRVDGEKVTTDTVPVFVENGITVTGPEKLQAGETGEWRAFGRQPVFNDPAKVEALELRDPNPRPRSTARRAAWVGWLRWGGPLLLLGLLAVAARAGNRTRPPAARGRRRLVPVVATATLGVGSFGGALAIAQQDIATSTGRDALPAPARVWTSGNARVLAPVAVEGDDPRRDPATQTTSGTFTARCPGTTKLAITSGFEQSSRAVTVASRAGKIARSVRAGARAVRLGRAASVASIRLAQPAVVRVRVLKGAKRVALLTHRCAAAGPVAARWAGKDARRGTYTVEVAVTSDRKPLIRRYRVQVR